jgi:hypothetical protein
MNNLTPRLEEFSVAVFNVLFPEEPEFNIDITRQNYELDDGANGYCFSDFDDECCFIDIAPDLSERETAITIAHELVHARQLANGLDFDEDEAYNLESVLTERCYH